MAPRPLQWLPLVHRRRRLEDCHPRSLLLHAPHPAPQSSPPTRVALNDDDAAFGHAADHGGGAVQRQSHLRVTAWRATEGDRGRGQGAGSQSARRRGGGQTAPPMTPPCCLFATLLADPDPARGEARLCSCRASRGPSLPHPLALPCRPAPPSNWQHQTSGKPDPGSPTYERPLPLAYLRRLVLVLGRHGLGAGAVVRHHPGRGKEGGREGGRAVLVGGGWVERVGGAL